MGGEADEVGTETEAGTLAGSEANRGAEQIEDGEDDRGNDGHDEDLLPVGHLAGDDDHCEGNGNTLKEVFQGAGKKLNTRKSVHFSYNPGSEKKSAARLKID